MRSTHFLCIIAVAILFTGCLEIENTTEVRQNGTLLRTVVITGDSAEIARGDFPLTLDARWRRTQDTTAEGKHRLTASREFADAAEMTRALKGIPGRSLSIEATLETEFDWFYTRYVYTETWKRYDPYMAVPITDFLSPAEIDLFRMHKLSDRPFTVRGDSLAMEDAEARFEQWRHRNMFESYFEAFLSAVRSIDSPVLTVETVESRRDTLFALAAKHLDQNNLDSIPKCFVRVLPAEETRAAFSAGSAEFESFRKKQEFEARVWGPGYHSKVRMPGILVETNARTIEGNTAQWSDFIGMCYFSDLEMTAVSRAVNWWMVLVPAALLLLIVILLAAGLFRRLRAHRRPGPLA